MRTVPLERDETAKQWRWKQFLVLHPRKQPAILCMHARAKFRLKAWKRPALIAEAQTARAADPDADFVAAVVETVQ
ncbi:MAG TPA: hypothetical protein VEZ16_00170 [Microvirga sp.]|nr:hypothetical protein [Microvirga sp.]